MKIQSLSILVPTGNKCVNNCPCCVSRLHDNCDDDRIGPAIRHRYVVPTSIEIERVFNDYIKRIQFVRDNDCNFLVLTGTGEPIMNKEFLRWFGKVNNSLRKPFYAIDIQTTGVMLTDENLDFLKDEVGVTTIALSIFDLFDSKKNFEFLNTNSNLYFDIDELCKRIKAKGFNLRICIMLTNRYDNTLPENMFLYLRELGADQATFRTLYKVEGSVKDLSNKALEVNKWIRENKCSEETVTYLQDYVVNNGTALNKLPFGAIKYSVDGISTVVDLTCMGKKQDPDEIFKFFILKEDAKLFSEWDDEGSLIF